MESPHRGAAAQKFRLYQSGPGTAWDWQFTIFRHIFSFFRRLQCGGTKSPPFFCVADRKSAVAKWSQRDLLRRRHGVGNLPQEGSERHAGDRGLAGPRSRRQQLCWGWRDLPRKLGGGSNLPRASSAPPCPRSPRATLDVIHWVHAHRLPRPTPPTACGYQDFLPRAFAQTRAGTQFRGVSALQWGQAGGDRGINASPDPFPRGSGPWAAAAGGKRSREDFGGPAPPTRGAREFRAVLRLARS